MTSPSQVAPMFPTMKEALSHVMSFNHGNSPFIFKDKGTKIKADSIVRAINQNRIPNEISSPSYLTAAFFFLARVSNRIYFLILQILKKGLHHLKNEYDIIF